MLIPPTTNTHPNVQVRPRIQDAAKTNPLSFQQTLHKAAMHEALTEQKLLTSDTVSKAKPYLNNNAPLNSLKKTNSTDEVDASDVMNNSKNSVETRVVEEKSKNRPEELAASNTITSTEQLLAWMYQAPVIGFDVTENKTTAYVNSDTRQLNVASSASIESGADVDILMATSERKDSGRLTDEKSLFTDITLKHEKKPADAGIDSTLTKESTPNSVHFQMALANEKTENTPMETITPRVGTTTWGAAISQKIVFMVGSGEQSATLTLNPPDLGPLQVVIKMKNDQVHTSFTSNQPEVRQALETALPQLRDAMTDSGLQLGRTSVSTGFSEQRPKQQDPIANIQQQDGHGKNDITDNLSTISSKLLIKNGLVDTYA
jgi:flagellar hook-length control protein FliK